MSEGSRTKYGKEALSKLSEETAQLFARYSVQFTPIIVQIYILGDVAIDRGWHEFTLVPRDGGPSVRKRLRNVAVWNRDSNGDWKISLHINNADVPEEIQGILSTWFLSEKQTSAEF
jgi:ketosteroid isomerase-like protein